jgi:hypothetical protein
MIDKKLLIGLEKLLGPLEGEIPSHQQNFVMMTHRGGANDGGLHRRKSMC